MGVARGVGVAGSWRWSGSGLEERVGGRRGRREGGGGEEEGGISFWLSVFAMIAPFNCRGNDNILRMKADKSMKESASVCKQFLNLEADSVSVPHGLDGNCNHRNFYRSTSPIYTGIIV